MWGRGELGPMGKVTNPARRYALYRASIGSSHFHKLFIYIYIFSQYKYK